VAGDGWRVGRRGGLPLIATTKSAVWIETLITARSKVATFVGC